MSTRARIRGDFKECTDICELWLYSIRNMHLHNEYPEGIEGTELEELYKEACWAGWPAEKRALYEMYVMNRNDYGNILEERFEDGMAIGFEKGLTQGIEQGIEKAVQRMALSGMTADTIAEIMGVSIEQVLKIAEGR